MKANFDFQEISSFIKEILQSFVKFLQNISDKVKQSMSPLKNSSPHYGLRATMAFFLCVYLIYILKCFLTIPVRDYYVDVYSVSPDSVVAQIDFVIGNKNIFNTYSQMQTIEYDSCKIEYSILKHVKPLIGNKQNRDITMLSRAMDSIYILSKEDSIYTPLLKTYNHYLHQDHLERDKSSTYIYTHLYENLYSSKPIGYLTLKNDSLHILSPINSDIREYLDNRGVVCGGGGMTPYICSLNLSLLADSISYNKLSRNHEYLSIANFIRLSSYSYIKEQFPLHKVENLSGGLSFLHPKPSYRGIYRVFPQLSLFLLKEDVSQAYYRFSFNATSIDSYVINIHSRGGVKVYNNPSDELRVLNLHDTQIIKHKKVDEELNETFTDTELLISFPENDNIQYIRLFFVTLIIGWLIHAFLKNAWSFVKHK